MANIKDVATAEVYGTAFERFTGVYPDIDYYDNYARVTWRGKKLEKMRGWFEKQMAPGGPPSGVQFDLGPVVSPWILKRAVPAIAGSILAGYFLGRLLK